MSDKLAQTYGAEYMAQRYIVFTYSALTIASLAIVISFAYPIIQSWFDLHEDKTPIKVVAKKVINYAELSAPPPIDLEKPPPETYKTPPKVKTVKFLTPVAKKDEEVEEEVIVPSMDEMETTQIGTFDQDGVDSILISSDQIIEIPPSSEELSEPYTFVQVMPEFIGGQEALLKYLSENITYPEFARDASIEGMVIVGFIVESSGKITNVEVLRGLHSSIDKEASRVIKSMPSWKAGEQNGIKVRVAFTVPVRFKLLEK